MWETELLALRVQTGGIGVGGPCSCKLVECGFEKGLTCVVVFYHAEEDIPLVVHGDDFTFCGGGPELLWIAEKMKSWFEIKVRRRRQACGDFEETCEVGC